MRDGKSTEQRLRVTGRFPPVTDESVIRSAANRVMALRPEKRLLSADDGALQSGTHHESRVGKTALRQAIARIGKLDRMLNTT